MGGGSKAVESVTLNKDALTLTVGQSETLVATIEPENAKNKDLTWSSSQITVATVNNGTVTAVSPGTAVITVTAEGDKTDTCTVTVKAQTNISENDWKAALHAVEDLQNGTLTIENNESTTLYYKGEIVTQETDLSELGAEVTPQALFYMMGLSENPEESSSTYKILIDIINGKIKVVNNVGEEDEDLSEYRVEGNTVKLYTTEEVGDESVPSNTVYGPYPTAEVAKNALFTLRNLEVLDEELIVEDSTVVTAIDAYSYFVPTDATTFVGNFKYKIFYSDEPVNIQVTINFDENKAITSAKAFVKEGGSFADSLEIPDAYKELFKDLVAERVYEYTYSLSDVGSTTISDDELVEADEQYTHYNYAISTDAEFDTLFDNFDIERGITFSTNDNGMVTVRKVGSSYHAFHEKSEYVNGENTIEIWKYYITSPNGIDVYDAKTIEGEYGEAFDSWKQPQNQPLTVAGEEFASLLKLLPEEVSLYFGTYNNGKKLQQLYSQFRFEPKNFGYDLNELTANLTFDSTDEEVEVVVGYIFDGMDEEAKTFRLETLYFNDSYVEFNVGLSNMEEINPLNAEKFKNAVNNTPKNSFILNKMTWNFEVSQDATNDTICYDEAQKILYVYRQGSAGGREGFVYKVEGTNLITVEIVNEQQPQRTSTSFDTEEAAMAALKNRLATVLSDKEVSADLAQWEFKVNGAIKKLPNMYSDFYDWHDQDLFGRKNAYGYFDGHGNLGGINLGEDNINVEITVTDESVTNINVRGTYGNLAVNFESEGIAEELEIAEEYLQNN